MYFQQKNLVLLRFLIHNNPELLFQTGIKKLLYSENNFKYF